MPEDDGGNDAGRVLMWIGLALVAVLLLGYPFGFVGGWYDNWGFFEGFFLMIFFFPILLIVLIVVLVVALSSGSRRPPPQPVHPAANNPESVAILERRYAAGELTRAEYLRMRKDLVG